MAMVHFFSDNIVIEVKEGTTILEAARIAGVIIESPCGGAGTCGKCYEKRNTLPIEKS